MSEVHGAPIAWVRLGARVNAHVPSETALLTELFVALLAFMHLLAGVRASVCDDITALSESLAAHITFEGFVSRVFAHVYDELRCMGTIFVAVRASMLGDAAVQCHLMCPHGSLGRELLVAVGTFDAPLH